MFSYKANDVNAALSYGLQHLLREGVQEESRAGTVLVAPGPVCVEYTTPRQRVLYSPTRDANHVFHLMEFLWFMSGSNDIEFPVFFNASYAQFSDDGKTMWDSYGWRWRKFFGYDQLGTIAAELRAIPTSRRCVLSMWNGMAQSEWHHPLQNEPWSEDLHVATHGGKAVPCNTHAYFAIKSGKLNMTVMNRSNDAMWGCFGANAVHFSFLLEYMAMRIGVPMGSYFQFTNNLHAYTDKFTIDALNLIEHECDTVGALPETGPAITEGFDIDLALFMPWALRVIRSTPPANGYTGDEAVLAVPACKTPFFTDVAIPMFLTWVYRKWKDEASMNICLDGIEAPDWKRAVSEWIDRRKKLTR